MTVIRVTKSFSFEMAHALWNYDGPCRHIHGHSYKLWVTVKGVPERGNSDPKKGMVIDFGDLKKIVYRNIVSRFDHALIISEESRQEITGNAEQLFDKLEVLSFQPTSENLILYFASILKENIPGNITLAKLKLQETETSYVEWYMEDN
ncbi:MAG: 6-carboxytetrahydropterin synthase [Chlorobi bacterium]|nr:6-carboxytetrahydropterin synthase [Chlorobiota bacterium]